MYQINLTFLRVRLVSNIRVYKNEYICVVLMFKNCCSFYVQNLVTGLTVREND